MFNLREDGPVFVVSHQVTYQGLCVCERECVCLCMHRMVSRFHCLAMVSLLLSWLGVLLCVICPNYPDVCVCKDGILKEIARCFASDMEFGWECLTYVPHVYDLYLPIYVIFFSELTCHFIRKSILLLLKRTEIRKFIPFYICLQYSFVLYTQVLNRSSLRMYNILVLYWLLADIRYRCIFLYFYYVGNITFLKILAVLTVYHVFSLTVPLYEFECMKQLKQHYNHDPNTHATYSISSF